MKQDVVSYDVAKKEIEKWAEAAFIESEESGEDNKNSFEPLIKAVVKGHLRVSEDGVLTQFLKFPIGDSMPIKELTYRNRITAGELQKRMSNLSIKSSDIDGRILCFISLLTTQPFAMVGKIDQRDYGVASTIASFFF
jgi:hypothetical protein